MIAILPLVFLACLPLAYLLGRRAERLHWNRRVEIAFERSYLNRTHHGRCHERL